MADTFSPLIRASDLLKIYNNETLVLVDASNIPRISYEKRHLDSALFVDVNTELADIKEDLAKGGRHPLPDIKDFSETLAKLGINRNSHVVVYDEKNGSNAAARFWWMLKSVGHEKVQVLDGGFQAAEKVGFPINSDIEIPKKSGNYLAERWLLPLADMNEVEEISRDENHLVIDVRDSERFRGEKEPIDLIAGHIPGAINIPLTTNMDENGLFLSPDQLKGKYQETLEKFPAGNVIVHCGSGVSACHTLLAIAQAGLEIPKLYVGSWSEWSRNNKEIATTDR
ncbi:MAG: sulfurtransferase [Algoriphagus sp.]|nr:sulfurtransferase [Algoriphagus sp.]